MGIINLNKNTVKNFACGFQQKYLIPKYNLGIRSVKYLKEGVIKKFKYVAPQSVRGSKQNIYMKSAAQINSKQIRSVIKRSGGHVMGPELKSLVNMASKSKPWLTLIFAAGGLDRLTSFNLIPENMEKVEQLKKQNTSSKEIENLDSQVPKQNYKFQINDLSKTSSFAPKSEILNSGSESVDSYLELKRKCKVITEKIIESKGKTVLFCGAGLSTSTGIPDYRSTYKTGLPTGPGKWETKENKEIYYNRNKSIKLEADYSWPSIGHLICKHLIKQNYVNGIVSQNVDGQLTSAGIDKEDYVDIHGNLRNENCTNQDCKKNYWRDFSTIWRDLSTIKSGGHGVDSDKHYKNRDCLICGSKLNDDIIYFGESLNKSELNKAKKFFNESENLLVLGSSMTVYPAVNLIYGRYGFLEDNEFSKKVSIVGLQHNTLDNVYYKVNGVTDAVLALIATNLGIVNLEDEVKTQFKIQTKNTNLDLGYVDTEKIGFHEIDFSDETSFVENYGFTQFLVGSKKYKKLIGDSLNRKVKINVIDRDQRKFLSFKCFDFKNKEISSIKKQEIFSHKNSENKTDNKNELFYSEIFEDKNNFELDFDKILLSKNEDLKGISIKIQFFKNKHIDIFLDKESLHDLSENNHAKEKVYENTVSLLPKLYKEIN